MEALLNKLEQKPNVGDSIKQIKIVIPTKFNDVNISKTLINDDRENPNFDIEDFIKKIKEEHDIENNIEPVAKLKD